jgi:NADH-quinone oxidoreductase subunit I
MAITTKKVNKPKMNLSELSYVPEIVRGLGLTMRRFIKNTFLPTEKSEIATVGYPENKLTYKERFRGVHRLTQRADGSPRCVVCLCCSTVCPAQCIKIEAAEYEPDDPRAGYERYPKSFVIDELRCIFCGLCVEACPCDAIRMDSGLHMPASTLREHFIFDKEALLAIPDREGKFQTSNTRHEPGDPTYPGVDRKRGH